MCQNESPSKTKKQLLLFFGCTDDDSLIGNQTFKKSHHNNYTGIIVEKRLIFQQHVSYIEGKLFKHFHVSRRLKLTVSRNVLRYYNAYVNTSFLYGLSIYGCPSKRKLEPFYEMQKILRI